MERNSGTSFMTSCLLRLLSDHRQAHRHPFEPAAGTLIAAILVLIVTAVAHSIAMAEEVTKRPNIVFIMADDLGYGDVGCYGQKQIRTPNIDRLAREGLRFTDYYAGSTVCAPSRCALMTGFHTGHARVRGNALVPLMPSDVTMAEVLHGAGYFTGIVGKWGLGEADSTGVPNRQGFDSWFGYLNQKHAHNYYPEFLWKNQEKFPLIGNVETNGVSTKRAQYSHDLFTTEALRFLDEQQKKPFFLYLAFTIPHANNEAKNEGMEIPSDEPYSDQPWPQPQKNHAAMITRLDTDIGRILDRLQQLGLADNTVVFFTSDNGPHKEGGGDPAFFQSSGPLRGYKRAMYDGGIRVPMIVRWPGHIAAETTTAQISAHWDMLPTMAELAGVAPPPGLDGISIVPTLLGSSKAGREQSQHEFLYWEFHEGGFKQAVRTEHWKAVRLQPGAALELYDLKTDLGESHDVAAEHADVVGRIDKFLATCRTDSVEFPIRAAAKKK
jgi:arylsulfatase A-like enzyme